MAITASMPETGQIVYARSDFLHLIWVRFFKEGLDILCKTNPALIWMARSVLPSASGPEASQCARIIGPGFWQSATSPLPVRTFRLGCVHPEMACIILCKTRLDPIWFWLTVSARFGPYGSGLKASQCARIIWPTSGQCFLADSDRMQTRSGMFTGTLHSCNVIMSSRNTAVRS